MIRLISGRTIHAMQVAKVTVSRIISPIRAGLSRERAIAVTSASKIQPEASLTAAAEIVSEPILVRFMFNSNMIRQDRDGCDGHRRPDEE